MADDVEMRNVTKGGVSICTIELKDSEARDALELARAGKKQALKRRFGLTSMIGLSCTIMGTWEAILFNLGLGLANGGPAGLIYGYLTCWLGSFCIMVCMGELASMLPTAGGQYHWTSILAPPAWRKGLSYVTGWISVLAWAVITASAAFSFAIIMQTVIGLNHKNYDPKGWQGALMMWAVLLLCMFINITLGFLLPTVEVLVLILHVLGFFAVQLPVVYFGRPGNAKAIFTTFTNEGEWPSVSLSFLIGLQGNAAAFLGSDGAVHMSEEVINSSMNVPRSMIFSVLLNGVLSFPMLVCVLYFAGDLAEVTASGSQFPFVGTLMNAIRQTGPVTVLAIVPIILGGCVTIAALASTSRLMWSFAREQALPGWRWLRRIDRRSSIPINTVYMVVLFAILIGFINIGSSVALADVTSLGLEGFYSCYLISVCLLLYRRLAGHIKEPSEDYGANQANDTATGKAFVWGPWRVKGWLGVVNNIVALVYLIVVGFFCFWPPVAKPTPETMNYSVLVLGVVALGSGIYYAVSARNHYEGPVVEIEVATLNS